MAKLYFRYGVMGSGKTLNLLTVADNYERQGKHVFLIKPVVDDRFGADMVQSRTGLKRRADMRAGEGTVIDIDYLEGVDCILVDECQFLSDDLVEQLRRISIDLDIPVICYGLRVNFMTRLFEGSKRLMELADAVEELKTTCAFCDHKAVYNIKLRGGRVCTSGDEVEIGADDLYKPVCAACFFEAMEHEKNLPSDE